MATNEERLFQIVRKLNERLWEYRVSVPKIEAWLKNFDATDREVALHLLSQFMYFGVIEVREMLRALYRDICRAAILKSVTRQQPQYFETIDGLKETKMQLKVELKQTRFIGIGNPSESGTHLLYYFRQENGLSASQFCHAHQLFDRNGNKLKIRHPTIKHYVFLDDFCGSGTQACQYSNEVVSDIKYANPNARVYYFSLLGLTDGLQLVQSSTRFDSVDAVFWLDESFKCFSKNSRYYLDEESHLKERGEQIARTQGGKLLPSDPLGYKDGQLLLGFSHNVPDNTLPIIWSDTDPWVPIFRRYHKE